VSEYLDRDRSELGEAFDTETLEELDELALSRSRATGRIVAVAAFAGGDRATVFDAALPPKGVSVELENPSPSLSLDVDDEP
jgi:hypothetical protein